MQTAPAAPAKKNTTLIIVLVLAGVLGLLSCSCVGLLIGVMLPALSMARDAAQSTQTMSHGRQLGIAMHAYANDWDSHLPPGDAWANGLIDKYVGNDPDLYTSSHHPTAGRAFAMNAQLSLVPINQITHPQDTVLLFECVLGAPPAGGPELLPVEPHGNAGYVILFADGHSEIISPQDLPQLNWEP